MMIKSQNVKLIENTPIIARKNCKSLEVFNNEMFIIKKYNMKMRLLSLMMMMMIK